MSTISSRYLGNLRFESLIGTSPLKIEVPPKIEGESRAPSAREMVAASLGACAGALVVNYCRRNGLDDQGITVDVTFEDASTPGRSAKFVTSIEMPKLPPPHSKELIEELRRQSWIIQSVKDVGKGRVMTTALFDLAELLGVSVS